MDFFATLCEQAATGGLPFLVIGGNAVIAYGYQRQTLDIDLFVREKDRRAWDSLILPLGYWPRHIHAVFHMYHPTRAGLPPVDLMLVDDTTFAKFSADAAPSTLEKTPVLIPSLPHLIALKLHALKFGGEHRHARDQLDVAELVRLNKVDLAADNYREIFQRYATERIRADLARLFERPEPPGPGRTDP